MISLQEDRLFGGSCLLGVSDPAIDNNFDIVLHVSEGLSLAFLRCMNIRTVATSSTISVACGALLLNGRVLEGFTHARPLPRIFGRVGKVNILAGDVDTSVPIVSAGRPCDDCLSENGRAVRAPVGIVDRSRTKGEDIIRSLEVPELSAVLPSPLSHVLLDINSCVLESYSVVLVVADFLLNSISVDSFQLGVHSQVGVTHKHITKLNTAAILHTHSVNI